MNKGGLKGERKSVRGEESWRERERQKRERPVLVFRIFALNNHPIVLENTVTKQP